MLKQTTKSLIIDKLKLPKETISELKNGEGKIIELEGKKVGVYKKGDELFTINPVCSHLGCELAFNNLDKTWDCPCHGSRFTYTGKSINAPSIKDLDIITLEN
ncbi:MAG: Rieske 2Fe-2S domain-containing protein [Oscillospiraceae bacterium]|nr:Rieske 2Fe-2S domain-containing protein [Oscillospiraceae bacterium]